MSIDPELALKTFDKLSDMEKTFRPVHSCTSCIGEYCSELCAGNYETKFSTG